MKRKNKTKKRKKKERKREKKKKVKRKNIFEKKRVKKTWKQKKNNNKNKENKKKIYKEVAEHLIACMPSSFPFWHPEGALAELQLPQKRKLYGDWRRMNGLMEDSADWGKGSNRHFPPFYLFGPWTKGGSQLKKREDTISQKAREQRGENTQFRIS